MRKWFDWCSVSPFATLACVWHSCYVTKFLENRNENISLIVGWILTIRNNRMTSGWRLILIKLRINIIQIIWSSLFNTPDYPIISFAVYVADTVSATTKFCSSHLRSLLCIFNETMQLSRAEKVFVWNWRIQAIKLPFGCFSLQSLAKPLIEHLFHPINVSNTNIWSFLFICIRKLKFGLAFDEIYSHIEWKYVQRCPPNIPIFVSEYSFHLKRLVFHICSAEGWKRIEWENFYF